MRRAPCPWIVSLTCGNRWNAYVIPELNTCIWFGSPNRKTTLDILALAYLLEHDPMPLLWALPSDNLAAPFSRNRLQPFLKANPCLSRHILRDPASLPRWK